MEMILQYYGDGEWGYKGFDDVEGLNGAVQAQQQEGEGREAFFRRVGEEPAKNEYGSEEMSDQLLLMGDVHDICAIAGFGYALKRIARMQESGMVEARKVAAFFAYEQGVQDALAVLINDPDPEVRAIAEGKRKPSGQGGDHAE